MGCAKFKEQPQTLKMAFQIQGLIFCVFLLTACTKEGW